MTIKRVLITGGAGYIGKHVAMWLSLHDCIVDVLDNRLENGVNCVNYYHQSILDNNRIEQPYDAVVHLAALVSVSGGQKAMMDYYRTNIIGTMNVLERFDYDNFIFASTCQVDEDHVYGQSKSHGEIIVNDYCSLNNKNYTIFQFGNVVGTEYGYKPTNQDGLLYNLMKARETGIFNVYGDDYDTLDGTAMRDYVHVMEIAQAIWKAVHNTTKSNDPDIIEYLGHNKLYSVLECVEAFKRVNDCDFDVQFKPRRDGDPSHVYNRHVSAFMNKNVYTLDYMMKV